MAQGRVTHVMYLYQAHLFPCADHLQKHASASLQLSGDTPVQEEKPVGRKGKRRLAGMLYGMGTYIHVSEAAAKDDSVGSRNQGGDRGRGQESKYREPKSNKTIKPQH